MHIPDGVPFDFRLAMEMSNTGFVGATVEMEENVKPLPTQFALTPGDHAVSVATPAKVDDSHTVMTLLDPADYAAQFPDWERRVQRSYVLGEWYSHDHPEPCVGWFSRVKLIPVTVDHFIELKQWCEKQDFPEEPPEWLNEAYYEYTEGLAQRAPQKIPRAVQCGACGCHIVEMHMISTRRYANRAGRIESDPTDHSDGRDYHYVHLSVGGETRTIEAHLHCTGCNSRMDLTQEEIQGLLHMKKHFSDN